MSQRIKQNVGIDCALDELVVSFSVLDDALDITVLANAVFKNNNDGFKKLLKWSSKLSAPGLEINYSIEATGVYHESVSLYLTEQKNKVSVILPNRAKAFFDTIPSNTITDKTCALMLSRMGLEKKLDIWSAPDPVFNQLKQLTRERSQVIDEQTQNKNQLHAEESGAWPNKSSIKRVKQRLQLLERQLLDIAQEIESIVDEHEEVKKKIGVACSITGIGLLTAVTIAAETNGFNLIRNKKQLTSYAGLNVMQKTSGKSVYGVSRISKRGNVYLRSCLYYPSLTAIRHTPEMKGLFIRLVGKHGIKKKALVAVQRKLLELVYVLWKKDEKYDPKYKAEQRKEEQPVKAALPELA